MGGSLSQLTSRQLERLKSELAEVIIANFCYPTFLDYRLNMLRTRPVGRRKRQEVWAYLNGLNLGPLDTLDASSMEFRRFVERVFLRAVEMNRELLVATSERQIAAVRARIPQLAAHVAYGLADYLVLGEASDFGRARPIESWASAAQGYNEPTWEQIEKSTQLLQTTLVYLRMNSTASAGQPMAAGGDQRDNKLMAVITAFPTQLLVSPSERPSSAARAANGAASPSGHDPLSDDTVNGAGTGATDGAMPPQVLLEPEPGPRRQFLGPARSATASRPLDPSLSPQVRATGGPLSSEALQSAQVSIKPAPPQPGLASMTPPEMPPPSPDAWQALLLPEGQEQVPEPFARDSSPKSPALPDDDLLALPESFGAPHLFDLPPDLAELYGDYLRESRNASLDLAALANQHPGVVLSQDESLAPQAPASETDEEIDALFSALTNQAVDLEEPEWAAIRDQNVAQEQSPGIAPALSASQVPGGSLHGSREPVPSLRPGEAVSSPGERADGLLVRPSVSHPLFSSGQDSSEPSGSAPLPLFTSHPVEPSAGEPPRPLSIKAGTDGDVMIFSQLQHQIFTWVKMAAISHQIDLAGRDAAELVAELRRAAALDEAELQVIESLVAICRRVATTKRATIEDYKQAMMLYVLHHRSRLAL